MGETLQNDKDQGLACRATSGDASPPKLLKLTQPNMLTLPQMQVVPGGYTFMQILGLGW